jgi:DNA-binding NtrC family response regulator
MNLPCLRFPDGKTCPLERRLATLGSDPECQIRVEGPGVKPHHAFVLFQMGRWMLRPLETGAVLRVDGRAVREECVLDHGVSIDVGSVVLVFLEREDETSDGAAASPVVDILESVGALLRSGDPGSVCASMAASTARLLSADGVRVIHRAVGEVLWRTLASHPAGAPSHRFSSRALLRAEEVGATVRMGETDLAALPAGESVQINGIHSLLCAPLRLSEEEEGFLYADRLAGHPPFDAKDEAVFGALCGLFSEVALQTSRSERQRQSIAMLEQGDGASAAILGRSAVMDRLLQEATRIAAADVPVHVFGETGTGKELLARHIHDHSARAAGPFVAINCGAIPENLVESELFGHEKGAFTGAVGKRVGWIEKADGGTLFLDEMGELPQALQVKLLRVLQEGEVVPVGGTQAVKVDFRLVTATHRDLREEVAAGRFRADLYWRLHVVRLELPPLRGREGDSLLLANHFLARYVRRHGIGSRSFSRAAEKAILEHSWPGNVRELENAVQKAVLLSSEERIRPRDLGLAGDEPEVPALPTELPDDQTLHGVRDRAEREAIVRALRTTRGNVSHASRILDADRKVLIRTIERLGIDPGYYK